jgi:hypothetical protein
MDTFLEVLKWIGIALAAGFVGYFGRYPAKLLLDKINARKKKPPQKPQPDGADAEQLVEFKTRRKIEKKQAKQAVKIAKKKDKT